MQVMGMDGVAFFFLSFFLPFFREAERSRTPASRVAPPYRIAQKFKLSRCPGSARDEAFIVRRRTLCLRTPRLSSRRFGQFKAICCADWGWAVIFTPSGIASFGQGELRGGNTQTSVGRVGVRDAVS